MLDFSHDRSISSSFFLFVRRARSITKEAGGKGSSENWEKKNTEKQNCRVAMSLLLPSSPSRAASYEKKKGMPIVYEEQIKPVLTTKTVSPGKES